MKEIVINLIVFYSTMYGVDPKISLAVAKVESNYEINVVGSHGEIGPFQILPEYAGVPKELLFNPIINVIIGVKRLKEEQELCSHKDDISFLVCYNYGRTNAKKVKYPKQWPYVIKVVNEMKNFQ